MLLFLLSDEKIEIKVEPKQDSGDDSDDYYLIEAGELPFCLFCRCRENLQFLSDFKVGKHFSPIVYHVTFKRQLKAEGTGGVLVNKSLTSPFAPP